MAKIRLSFFLLWSCFSWAQGNQDVFYVARKGTLNQAVEIYKINPNAFNTVNEEGFSPLILACYRFNNEVAKFLIEKGCNINQNSSMGTALMAATVKGNNEMIMLLLQKKADVNLTDSNDTTALMYATMLKNKEAITQLLKNNADKTKKDSKGKTAFEYAVFSGDELIIDLLK